jgi:chemotaxis protein CheZ
MTTNYKPKQEAIGKPRARRGDLHKKTASFRFFKVAAALSGTVNGRSPHSRKRDINGGTLHRSANSGEDGVQRKRYRIEDFLPARATLAARQRLHNAAAPKDTRPLESGAAELAAAMEAMEKACALMLGTAERVEDHARAISAAARSKKTRALATDIQEQMARVYELSNFQDLAGQRIAKVIRLLTGDPEPPANERASRSGGGLVNGPRLDGGSGYVTQDDVDALFGYKAASA